MSSLIALDLKHQAYQSDDVPDSNLSSTMRLISALTGAVKCHGANGICPVSQFYQARRTLSYRVKRMTLELRACLIWSYWEILSSTTLNTRAAAQTLCRKFATYYHQDGAHRYSPSMGLRLLTFPTRFSACRKSAPISYSVLGVTTH